MKRFFSSILVLLSVSSSFAAGLTIYTEDSPPFQFTKDGKITGVASDVFSAMMAKSGVEHTHEMVPWKRAYEGAKDIANTCVYSTTETESRMPLFKWVGPIVSNDWVVMATNESAVKATKLEDLKGLTIGGYNGDAVAEFLKKEGYKVDEAANDQQNVKKLAGGRIDVWATSDVVGPYLAKVEGVSNLKKLFTFKSTVMSLACNKSVSDEIIGKLKAALKAIEADGTIAKIKANYK